MYILMIYMYTYVYVYVYVYMYLYVYVYVCISAHVLLTIISAIVRTPYSYSISCVYLLVLDYK